MTSYAEQSHTPDFLWYFLGNMIPGSKNVPMFGPPIPAGALFSKSSSFTKFILTKVINAENAAHRSDKFVLMATRTRQEYLKDLATNYSTQTTIDSGSKFGKSDKKLDYRPNDIILFQLFSLLKRSFQ